MLPATLFTTSFNNCTHVFRSRFPRHALLTEPSSQRKRNTRIEQVPCLFASSPSGLHVGVGALLRKIGPWENEWKEIRKPGPPGPASLPLLAADP